MSIKSLINIGIIVYFAFTTVTVFAETVVIEIKDSQYGNGEPVTVNVGTTVKWLNVEKRQYHSVWFEAEGFPEAEYIFPEETWERTFDKPGTYPYRCEPHEDMIGTIIVVE
ncbi:MAG: plastocyanin [Proteobacteria bacterium]|nr:plastocyanin [Pseudomonadota bacterium]NOG61550.1 plastocyanin [Pseudomonadota bacterium]